MNHFAPLNGKDKPELTLEMESLLVHGDGECAVVLVINADYSSLGQSAEERGRANEGE